jgi:hypothetical protein
MRNSARTVCFSKDGEQTQSLAHHGAGADRRRAFVLRRAGIVMAGPAGDRMPEHLMARGIDRTNAERLVVQGFFEEVLDRIPVEGVRNKLETEIAVKLGL